MNELLRNLLGNAKGNPVGVVLAGLALVCYGGGQKLSEALVEPFGTILQGVAGVLVLVAGAWVGKKKEPPQ
jgi:hypothetical protein